MSRICILLFNETFHLFKLKVDNKSFDMLIMCAYNCHLNNDDIEIVLTLYKMQ